MNKNQKIVLAIFVPIIIFFIVLMITNLVGVTHITHIEKSPFPPHKLTSFTRTTHNSFDWEKTWYVWLLFLVFCCIFEYKLFRDKEGSLL